MSAFPSSEKPENLPWESSSSQSSRELVAQVGMGSSANPGITGRGEFDLEKNLRISAVICIGSTIHVLYKIQK